MTSAALPPRPVACGRFAPSPTGPLHAGSLVAALASWLDAKAQGGHWLVRIEDVDSPRCPSGMGDLVLRQLAACGMVSDGPVVWQSQRDAQYAAALGQLRQNGQVFDCACSRAQVAQTLRQGAAPSPRSRARFEDLVYPGTCRQGLHGKPARAVRFRADGVVQWPDRWLGPQWQDVAQQVGDFVLKRADGLWAYQLAVVVDDAAQGITHVVRGQDLADNTARQILLQRALGLPTPQYLHTPLVLSADGNKLSKQNGAQALDVSQPVAALQAAARVLGLPELQAQHPAGWLQQAVPAWAGIIAALQQRQQAQTGDPP